MEQYKIKSTVEVARSLYTGKKKVLIYDTDKGLFEHLKEVGVYTKAETSEWVSISNRGAKVIFYLGK